MSLYRLWQPLVMDRNQLFHLAASQGKPEKLPGLGSACSGLKWEN